MVVESKGCILETLLFLLLELGSHSQIVPNKPEAYVTKAKTFLLQYLP